MSNFCIDLFFKFFKFCFKKFYSSSYMTLVCFGLAIGGWFLYKTLRRAEPATSSVPTQKHTLERKELAKGFFNPVMIVHIAVSLVLAGILVFYALTLPLMQ